MDELIKLIGVSLAAVVTMAALKGSFPEAGGLLGITATVVMHGYSFSLISPLLSEIRALEDGSWNEILSPVLRATAVAAVCECAASVCRDSGQASVGEGLLIVGRAEILLISVPLITELLRIAGSLFSS